MKKSAAITLPPPPLCAPHPGNFVHVGEDVVVNLQNGTRMEGVLKDFRMGKGTVSIEANGETTPTVIPLSQVNTLYLTEQRKWIRRKVLEIPGAKVEAPPADKIDYEVELKNGELLSGDTLGIRTDHNGLYLFPVADQNHYTYAFIPHNAIEKRRIGQRIGEILVEQKVVSEKQIDEALTVQEERRNLPIGAYLREKAIVSIAELERALDRQKVVPHMKLGEILIGEGFINEEQLNAALEEQKNDRKVPLGQILIRQGLVTSGDIQQCLAKKLGIPFVDLKNFEIPSDITDLVPAALARQHQIVPLHLHKNKLVVAVENPMHWEPLDAVRFHTKLFAEPVMASGDAITETIAKLYTKDEVDDFSFDDIDESELEVEESVQDDDEFAVSDNVIVKLINKIIIDAHNQEASDIHIEPYANDGKTVVRIRKDGNLVNFLEIPAVMRNKVVARVKIMSGLDIAERRKPQDGKIDFRRRGKQRIELRVATLPTVGGQEDVVMRILPSGDPILIDNLGLSKNNYEEVVKAVSKPYGLFFVCGPTGSGKSTTLHSILRFLNTTDRKIWTAEDPVEIRQKGLRQVQVLPKIGLDFAAAMRSFLRADPDIIMVGEMRDLETTKTGIEASLTGHMVFSTLHTNSAAESIIRLLDMGMDPFSFADALNGILAQRLARRLCPDCKKGHKASAEEMKRLLQEYCQDLIMDKDQDTAESLPDIILNHWRDNFADKNGAFTLYESVGCDKCDGIGYKGRFGIHELLIASDTIKRCILEHKRVAEIVAIALEEGMRTLKQDGMEKVLQGITDMSQVRKVCVR
ncbi:MAG: ATPase, T2SS/T4P/T4SS family [Gammaproteobacteria bacterium]